MSHTLYVTEPQFEPTTWALSEFLFAWYDLLQTVFLKAVAELWKACFPSFELYTPYYFLLWRETWTCQMFSNEAVSFWRSWDITCRNELNACVPFKVHLLHPSPPMWWYLDVRAFGRWLGHEGRALLNGISAYIEEAPECSLVPSIMWGHSKKMTI